MDEHALAGANRPTSRSECHAVRYATPNVAASLIGQTRRARARRGPRPWSRANPACPWPTAMYALSDLHRIDAIAHCAHHADALAADDGRWPFNPG